MNIRYVVTGIKTNGLRGLVGPARGHDTYATPEEAFHLLDLMLENNSPKLLASTCGTDLAVCSCECWPGHNDPKRVWFKESDVIRRGSECISS